jgi:hypothetical protein
MLLIAISGGVGGAPGWSVFGLFDLQHLLFEGAAGAVPLIYAVVLFRSLRSPGRLVLLWVIFAGLIGLNVFAFVLNNPGPGTMALMGRVGLEGEWLYYFRVHIMSEIVEPMGALLLNILIIHLSLRRLRGEKLWERIREQAGRTQG